MAQSFQRARHADTVGAIGVLLPFRMTGRRQGVSAAASRDFTFSASNIRAVPGGRAGRPHACLRGE